MCNATGTYDLANGVVTSPSGPSPEATPFQILCDTGYTESENSGTLECDDMGIWTNKPHCIGKPTNIIDKPTIIMGKLNIISLRVLARYDAKIV